MINPMHLSMRIPISWPTLLMVASLSALDGCADNSVVAEKTPSKPAAEAPKTLSQPVNHQNLSVGAKLLRSGQFLDAEIVLRALLVEQPQCARGEFLLGVAVMKQKKYSQARPLLESSLARDQDFAERAQVDHFIGWCCYYLGDLDSAKRAFQSHVGTNPTADDSYFGLGVIAIDEDRMGDAELALGRAIELIGPHPARSRDRAKCLARLGDVAVRKDKLDEALALYEEASQLWPDHYEVWGKIARVYDALLRPVEAESARATQHEAMQRVGRAAPPESAPESAPGSAP